MADIGAALVARVEVKLDRLTKDLKKVGVLADDAIRDVEDKFKRANPSFGGSFTSGLFRGLFSAAAFTGLVAAIRNANKEMAELERTARQVGVTTDKLQEFRFAAGVSGAESGTLDKTLQSLAAQADETRRNVREENNLQKLFKDNNIALRDRNGIMLTTEQIFLRVAELIRNTATEQEKIKIAERLSIPVEILKSIDNGAAAFLKIAENAKNAGVVIDREVLAQAAEFDRKWNEAILRVTATTKSWLLTLQSGIADVMRGFDAPLRELEDSFRGGSAGANRVRQAEELFDATKRQREEQEKIKKIVDDYKLDPAVKDKIVNPGAQEKALQTLAAQLRARTLAGGDILAPQPRAPLAVTVRARPTVVRGEEQDRIDAEAKAAQQRLDKYVDTLLRQKDVEEAIGNTIFLRRPEQLAAIEIARAQTDLDKLNLADREKAVEKIREATIALEEQRQQTERNRAFQQSLNQAIDFAGNSVIDGLDRIIVGGEKFADVLKDVGRQLARMILQAALLGNGPLAGLFGTTGSGGSAGGLLGGLFSGLGSSLLPASGAIFNRGGFTGRGNVNDVAGLVHRGEFVMDAESTRRAGPRNLAKLQRSLRRGFKDGGYAGSGPVFAQAGMGTGSPNGMHVTFGTAVDKQGNIYAFVEDVAFRTSSKVTQQGMASVIAGEPTRRRQYQARVA